MHGGNVWQGEGPGQWLDYSANIRPGGPPEWVREALRDGMRDISWYPDPDMVRAREALGRFLGLPEDWVLPTAGGVSAIALADGWTASETWRFTPCFDEYARRAAGAVRTASLLPARHTVGDPAARVAGALRDNCAVWLCNPHNPLGVAFSREQVLRLLDLVESKNGRLIVDEAFIEYCPEYTSTALLAEHAGLVIAGSLTKILGIPGVRAGYLCAQPQVIEALRCRQLPWELNCFAGAALRALPDHREDLRRFAAENARRRASLRAGLERLGAFVYPSEAPFLLADFGRPVAPLAKALKGARILVRECLDFEGIDDGAHLRFAVRTDAENKRLMDALGEGLSCAGNP